MTLDGVKAGLTPAAFWAMPVHHMAHAFFKSPHDREPKPDLLAVVARRNAGAVRPFIPHWLLAR